MLVLLFRCLVMTGMAVRAAFDGHVVAAAFGREIIQLLYGNT